VNSGNWEGIMKRVLAIVIVGLATFAMGGCAGCTTAPAGGSSSDLKRLDGAGSSFVYPLMTKWASEYEKAKGLKVNYESIGSGAGIKGLTEKSLDFGCSDAPMNDEQLDKVGGADKVVHVPLVMGAVVPIYNLEGIEKPLQFSGPVLADIYLGKIKKWNHDELKKINPGVNLPDKEILTIHREDGSGTTYIWTEFLSKVSGEWKDKVGKSTKVDFPGGEGAKGSEGVSGKVAQSPGSIGYVEITYAIQNNIKFGKVQNHAGEFITPSLDSVTAAAEKVDFHEDLRYSLTDPPGKDAYPISGTVWAVIYKDMPAGKGLALVQFLRWCTHEGQQYTKDLHYAKLPDDLVKRVDAKLGTVTVEK
jgi:phosphate transport system substrate-binding protein